MMVALAQDIKYAIRLLLKSPGFTTVAVFSLAVGIGANTAIFSIIKVLLLESMPVFEPERLVVLETHDKASGLSWPRMSYPNFLDYQSRQTVFEGMAAYVSDNMYLGPPGADPQRVYGEFVSGNYFRVLGARPLLGQTLDSTDDVPNQQPRVVLGYQVWQQRFGASPRIVGSLVELNGHPFTVAGVMPASFRGAHLVAEPQVWIPAVACGPIVPRPEALWERKTLALRVIARLKPGVTLPQAEAALQPITQQLQRDFPEDNRGRSLILKPASEVVLPANIRKALRTSLALTMGVVGLVLLVACGNVASLLLVRANHRAREFAIRAALGAGGWQLSRQTLVESILLALAAGAVGLLIGRWTRDVLWRLRPPQFTGWVVEWRLDPGVLLFTLLLTLGTGILFGLAPALNVRRRDLVMELRARAAPLALTGGFWSARKLLVCGQCALCALALVGAGLFLESARKLDAVDTGFDLDRLAVVRVSVNAAKFSRAQAMQYYQDVRERLSQLAGVQAVGLSGIHLFSAAGASMRDVKPEGADEFNRQKMVLVNMVSPGYFEAAGLRLIDGRPINESDTAASHPVAVVNEAMARHFWPNQRAVGKRFLSGADRTYREVVGVVSNAKLFSLDEEGNLCMYLPLTQQYAPAVSVFVKAASDPKALLGQMRGALRQIARQVDIGTPMIGRELAAQSMWAQRMLAVLLSTLSLLALLLAAVGVYGLTSYGVVQRTAEIGVRVALGAGPGLVVRQFVGETMRLVVPGLLLGSVAAFVCGRLASSLIFGVGVAHPPAYLMAATLLTMVALAASWVPARHALRVDPVAALRRE